MSFLSDGIEVIIHDRFVITYMHNKTKDVRIDIAPSFVGMNIMLAKTTLIQVSSNMAMHPSNNSKPGLKYSFMFLQCGN